jgi:inorganic triphosphatase YgiF
MMEESHEVEVALLIASDDAPEIAAHIARLTHLAGHALAARADERLHDVHYDTAGHALRAKGLALRTRLRNGNQFITFKGPARARDGGAVSRMEIEEAWTEQAFRKAVDELGRQQIRIDNTRTSFAAMPPAAVMRAGGLIAIQERQTHRQIRDIIASEGGVRLAELAIDEVEYQFADARVSLFEIEIEAKHSDGPAVLKACAESLQNDSGAMLRSWAYGKLATGTEIERLLRSGELTPVLVNGMLVGARASLLLEDRLRA